MLVLLSSIFYSNLRSDILQDLIFKNKPTIEIIFSMNINIIIKRRRQSKKREKHSIQFYAEI